MTIYVAGYLRRCKRRRKLIKKTLVGDSRAKADLQRKLLGGTCLILIGIESQTAWLTPPSPVTPPDPLVMEHGPDISRPANNGVDFARAIKRHKGKSFAKVCLRNIVVGAAWVEHVADDVVRKGLARFRLKVLPFARTHAAPHLID
ncbi:hypothetical protein [Litchfieldella qijiaojingensis]|uniref:hypothetical protein n=1 Tax=Litchfieldella qijiaojingensis TaxID=980347 RepID=UPI0016767FE1|nr:hypothetical protein [Halomonas qijiaojingensis]